MLRITTEKKKGRTVLNVEGRLSGPRVPMLEQCWREMRADAPDEKFQVNLCGVTFIDAAGKILLKGMYSEGAQLLAEGCLNQAIVSEITAEQKTGGAEKRGKGPGFFFYIAFFSLVFGAKPGFAQSAAQPGSLKLTLEQSVALALKQNTTAQIVILLVVSQYIGSLRAEANVTASKSRVELAQALYDQAADLQKEGVGTGIDTLRANVELQNEKQAMIQAENDRDSSLYILSRLLNLDPRQKVELADSLGFFDTPQPEIDSSIDAALATRAEWKSIDQQVKAAQRQKQASQAERLPSLQL